MIRGVGARCDQCTGSPAEGRAVHGDERESKRGRLRNGETDGERRVGVELEGLVTCSTVLSQKPVKTLEHLSYGV